MFNANDDSEDHLIRVPGIENYEIGVNDDGTSSDEEIDSDDSEYELDTDDSDANIASDEEWIPSVAGNDVPCCIQGVRPLFVVTLAICKAYTRDHQHQRLKHETLYPIPAEVFTQ